MAPSAASFALPPGFVLDPLFVLHPLDAKIRRMYALFVLQIWKFYSLPVPVLGTRCLCRTDSTEISRGRKTSKRRNTNSSSIAAAPQSGFMRSRSMPNGRISSMSNDKQGIKGKTTGLAIRASDNASASAAVPTQLPSDDASASASVPIQLLSDDASVSASAPNQLPTLQVPRNLWHTLPPELRVMILGYLLVESDIIDFLLEEGLPSCHHSHRVTPTSASSQSDNGPKTTTHWPMNIFLTSKRFYAEAAPIFFQQNTFYLANHAHRTTPDRIAPILRGPGSSSLRHGMRNLILSIPIDCITALLMTHGNALTTMATFHSLTSLVVRVERLREYPRCFIPATGTHERRRILDSLAFGGAVQAARDAPTSLPSLNEFLAEGLPRLVALLRSPWLRTARLLIFSDCHPAILCPFHQELEAHLNDMTWMVCLPNVMGTPNPWGLQWVRRGGPNQGSVLIPIRLGIDLQRLAKNMVTQNILHLQ